MPPEVPRLCVPPAARPHMALLRRRAHLSHELPAEIPAARPPGPARALREATGRLRHPRGGREKPPFSLPFAGHRGEAGPARGSFHSIEGLRSAEVSSTRCCAVASAWVTCKRLSGSSGSCRSGACGPTCLDLKEGLEGIGINFDETQRISMDFNRFSLNFQWFSVFFIIFAGFERISTLP